MNRVTVVDGRCRHGGCAQDKRRIRLDRRRTGRVRIAPGIVLLVLAVTAGGTAQAAAGSGQIQPVGSIACVRDVPAVIHGKHECLGPGEYCSRAYEREYERYGFVCSTSYDPPRLRRG